MHDIKLPSLPAGHGNNEHPFGVLTNIPLVWLAVAAPLAWRGRSADVRCLLRGFLGAVALLFATRALTLCFFRSTAVRYEWEFSPALVLLAVVGILGLERALAGQRAWRWAARWAWSLLLAFSLAFNLCASTIYHAGYHSKLGSLLLDRTQVNEAIAQFKKALMLRPDDPETHNNLGAAFARKGQTDDAIRQYQETLRLEPDYARAHNNLGAALAGWRESRRDWLDEANAHNGLGVALQNKGQTDEAVRQLQEAIRLLPEYETGSRGGPQQPGHRSRPARPSRRSDPPSSGSPEAPARLSRGS